MYFSVGLQVQDSKEIIWKQRENICEWNENPTKKNWNPVPNFYQSSQNRKTNNPILGILGTLEHQNTKRAKKKLISKIYQSPEH